MKKFLSFLGTQLAAIGKSLKQIVQSRTVQACAAGLLVRVAVTKGWLPENFVTGAVEAATYILAAIFRVVAVDNIKPGDPANKLS